MSTQIAILHGKQERAPYDHGHYQNAVLHVTRFYGGAKRGISIQFTIDPMGGYIQLDNDTANRLLEALRDALGHISQEEMRS